MIPTYKRPQSLIACVNSILEQIRIPDELLVIDDDTLILDEVMKLRAMCADKMSFVYYKKDHSTEPRGSATSRNIGIHKSLHDIVYIFDDDLVLESDFIGNTMAVWESNKDKNLFAVGGVISNNRIPSKWETLYHHIGGLGNMNIWDVNKVGFQSWNDGVTEITKGYYAHGGVCSYSKRHLATLGGFFTFQGGRTALEDVDFFLRAKLKGFSTMILPTACVRHDHSPLGRENKYKSGYKEGFNRVQIFKNHTPKSFQNLIWWVWASTAWTSRKILSLQFSYAWGMLVGSSVSLIKNG